MHQLARIYVERPDDGAIYYTRKVCLVRPCAQECYKNGIFWHCILWGFFSVENLSSSITLYFSNCYTRILSAISFSKCTKMVLTEKDLRAATHWYMADTKDSFVPKSHKKTWGEQAKTIYSAHIDSIILPA